MSVDHFAFLVDDMDRAIAFYRGILGLTFRSRQTEEAHGEEFAFFDLEGGNLELLRKIPAPKKMPSNPPEERAFCPHLALKTVDIERSLQSLREKGVSILKGPLEIPNEVKWAYFQDPDGNILEYVQWL